MANIKKISVPTKEEVIKDMKMSKLLWLTKNNKFYSLVAEEYMHDKEKYLLYVKESKRKEFMNNYRDVLQMAGSVSDIVVYANLMHWEHTGEILMLLSDNIDWDAIRESIYNHGHTTKTLNELAHKIIYFSMYGIDFIEHIFGKEERIIAEKEIDSATCYFSLSFTISTNKCMQLI